MSDVPPTVPAPDAPWGTYRRGLVFRVLLGLTRAVPQVPLVKQLAFPLRRLARASVADPVDVTHWGHRLRLRTRGNFSEGTFLFMPRRWDWRERRFLRRELRRGAVFVDVGANAGGYIWWVLHLLGRDCTIVAVEPEPGLHHRLAFNLRTNGFAEQVRVLCVAAGAESGEGWLVLDPHNSGENVLVPDASPTSAATEANDGGRIRVPVRRLPELVAESRLTRVDALKVDVDGLEAAILRDYFDRAPPRLWPRILLVERNSGPAHDALMDRLARLGYRQQVTSPLNVVLKRVATRSDG
jgi:FkbM family methyltransferase